jgi:hypothetical protein
LSPEVVEGRLGETEAGRAVGRRFDGWVAIVVVARDGLGVWVGGAGGADTVDGGGYVEVACDQVVDDFGIVDSGKGVSEAFGGDVTNRRVTSDELAVDRDVVTVVRGRVIGVKDGLNLVEERPT